MPPQPLTRAQSAAEQYIAGTLGVTDWHLLKQDTGTLVGAGLWSSAGPSGAQREPVVVKWWSSAGVLTSLKQLVGQGRGNRQAAGAELLRAAGVRVPTVRALHNILTGPARGQVLIMERLPGKTLLQHLADRDLTVRQEHAVARAVGKLLAALSDAQIHNRDGKPSNIMVTRVDHTDAEVAFIDTLGIRRMRFMPAPSAVMLKNLLVEPIGCGVLPRRAVMMRAYRWEGPRPAPEDINELGWEQARDEWRMIRDSDWESIATLVREHGDPRPKINPLAR
jgi:tRNA A-37 threonylcarbamoyl transferase component Bud32